MRNAIVLATFLLGFGLCAPALRAQESEPNNTCAQANPIQSGSYSGWSTDEYDPPTWPEVWDYDWFRIALPARGQLVVTTTNNSIYHAGELQHTLYVSSGGCPGTWSDSWANPALGSVQRTFVNPTDQAIDVYLLLNAWFYAPYEYTLIHYALQIAVTSGGCSSGVEDRFETGPAGAPVPIAPGVHAGLFARSGNDDAYTLRLAQGTSIRARIDFAHAAGDLDLSVSDGTNTTVSNGATDVEIVDFTTSFPIGAGPITIRVAAHPGPDATCNSYALSIEVLQTPIGTSYCQAGVNGYTTEARILAAGSSSVSANLLRLWCQAFPGANPGILIASPTQAQVPFGDGFRCVGGAIRRLGGSSAVDHVAVYAPDFTSGQGLAIAPGTTWNFQAFYRDTTLPGGAGFNLTDGVSIAMTP